MYFYVTKIRIRFGVFSLGENVRLIKRLSILLFYDHMSLAVIVMGLYLVSFRSQKLSLFAFCLCTMGFGLWEFHLAASSFILIIYHIFI